MTATNTTGTGVGSNDSESETERDTLAADAGQSEVDETVTDETVTGETVTGETATGETATGETVVEETVAEGSEHDRAPDPDASSMDTGAGTDSETGTDTEPATDSDSDANDESTRPTARSGRGRRAARIIAGAVVVAAGIGAGLLWREHQQHVAAEAERGTVLAAAKEATTAILSYRAASVDADVAAAEGHLTGTFRDYYTTLAQQQVIPAAKERKLTSTVTISGASLAASSPTTATALLFVNQMVGADTGDPNGTPQTTTPQTTTPQTTATAIRVTLSKHDSRWLVERFEPI